jgi:hypothetical protein
MDFDGFHYIYSCGAYCAMNEWVNIQIISKKDPSKTKIYWNVEICFRFTFNLLHMSKCYETNFVEAF